MNLYVPFTYIVFNKNKDLFYAMFEHKRIESEHKITEHNFLPINRFSRTHTQNEDKFKTN